tara:strand:- start:178 stop:441 length:264 start_codon:yes stop_codon:yes gene_type:complete
MKKCIWLISLYFDDEKTILMFQKEYKNILEIKKEFNLGKSFLYECCNNKKYKKDSRKSNILEKYKRLTIEKKTFDKQGNFIKSSFNI